MQNEYLSISVANKGAELTSIKSTRTGFEFLWQANPAIWARHAPILFPIVGKVKSNELMVNGKSYPMNQHGFARDCDFELFQQSKHECWYQLVSNEHTLKIFPFHFELYLGYEIVENTLICKYKVINKGSSDLYFSIGAHPGFNLPTGTLNDYIIEFAKAETEERLLLEAGLFNHQTKPVLNSNGNIDLSKALFDDDAIVFMSLQSTELILKQKAGSFAIKMQFDGFPYFGIWTQKGCESYICLEPWCGHADFVDGHLDISAKAGIVRLTKDSIFERSYAITFTE